MPTYTFIGSKKEPSKCLLTSTLGARESTAIAYLYLHREQERAQQVSTYTYIGSKKIQKVPTYTYIGSKKEHSKYLLSPT